MKTVIKNRMLIAYHIFLMLLMSNGLLHSQTSFVFDDFDKETKASKIKQQSFINFFEGYGVYSNNAIVDLMRVPINPPYKINEKVLRIESTLAAGYGRDNWLSIRRDFDEPKDLRSFKGVKINIKVVEPAEVQFRLTLIDLQGDREELWWHNFPRALLKSKKEWATFCLPFDTFILSHGVGTRHNNFKIDLEKISGYEINLISTSDNAESCVILVNDILTY